MAKLERIQHKNILLCEGKHDSEFFTNLIMQRSLPQFQVCSVGYVFGVNAGGNSKYTEALDALMGLSGITIENILIVSDNDQTPTKSFNRVVAQIDGTSEILDPPKRRLVAPAKPLQKAGMHPSVSIMMLPKTGIKGNLDTMCLTAALNRSPKISNCVEEFARCTGADGWPEAKLNKMKLRAILCGSWKDDPDISPAYVWSKKTNLIPLSDPIFDEIAKFLEKF